MPKKLPVPADEKVMEKMLELEKKMNLMLTFMGVTAKDFDQLFAYLDQLKEQMSLLSKEAQNVLSFYAALKKQEQEIFWNDVKGKK